MIVLDEVELSRPGPFELLVAVRAAGVGPWDALVRTGHSGVPQPLPLTLGADLAGTILDAGAYARRAIVDASRVGRKPAGIGRRERYRLGASQRCGLPALPGRRRHRDVFC